MDLHEALALSIALPVVLFPLAFVWTLFGAGVREAVRARGRFLICSVDADCPPGHVCIRGRCEPA